MPQPPVPTEPERVAALDRRMFCLSALAAGVTLACSGGGGSAAPAAPPPPPANGPQTTADTKAALLATPDGTARDYRNLGFMLLKDATGLYAMTSICTHMGCTVGMPVGTHITCPCHGSQYDLQGGNQIGPATSPLVHYEVTEPSPGAFLVVNTAQTVSASTRLA
jgi:nitrite reductase/ring-hydroxylating ferredoxin subunit